MRFFPLFPRFQPRAAVGLTTSALVLASVSFIAFAPACGSSDPGGPSGDDSSLVRSNLQRDSAPAVAPADATALFAGNTKFAFDLYQSLVHRDDTTNLVYSPYSISIALAMTYAGAADPTAGEMAKALDFTLAPAALHPAFNALDLALASRAMGQSGSDGQPFQLNIADSIWGEASLKFAAPFLDTLAVNYGAGMHVVDFVHGAEPARGRINGWVSDATNSRIVDLLPQGSITADTRLVLVNAIYFNAGWAVKFEPGSTMPGPFHHLDGTTTNPDMMSKGLASAGYSKGSNFQAVDLAYDGGTESMILIVPDDGAFADVEVGLTGDFVGSLFSSLEPQSVAITLPKFTTKGATISLKSELSQLGMTDAFTPAANFSAMTADAMIYLDDVLHQAFVKVDETGTEAAAATGVIGVAKSAFLPTQTVTVDRPFFYVIRDIPTGAVLFVGREVDPQ